MVFYFCVLCISQLASSHTNGPREEAFESLVRTVSWCKELGSHDLELVCSTEIELSDPERGVNVCQIMRERQNVESEVFAIGLSEGRSHFKFDEGEVKDGEKATVIIGGSDFAREYYSTSAGVGKYRCPKGDLSCLEIARPFDIRLLPAKFYLSGDNTDNSSDIVMHVLGNAASKIHKEKAKIKHFGQERDVTKYRVFVLSKTAEGKSFPLGYVLTVGRSGASKGLLLEFKYVNLKLDATEFESDEDLRYVERVVATRWEEKETSTGKIVVPVQIKRSFFDNASHLASSREVQRISFNWKSFDAPGQADMGLEEMRKIVMDYLPKIDKNLNR
jgi:hypothetical protein